MIAFALLPHGLAAPWRVVVANPGRACPFCQSIRVTAVAVEGLHGELVAFRCEECDKRWSEAVSDGKAGGRGAIAVDRHEH